MNDGSLIFDTKIDSNGFENGIKDMKKNSSSLGKTFSGLKFKALATVAAITAISVASTKLIKTYAQLRNSVQRVNELFRENNKYIKYFAENIAMSFGMAESTAYQYAMTYGNLFKGITKDTQENAKVTIAMMKASAVISSKTGRTMEDVNERIRSGILGNTEAIEDLGINVPVAMLKTTKAFKEVGKGVSWDKLTYQQQQQIRVLAILEQTTNQYGNTVSHIAGWSLPRLGQAFKDLMSYAGMFVTKALQPIINALGYVVTMATQALKAIAKLLNWDLAGGVKPSNIALQQGYTDAVDDTTNAIKKQKKELKSLAGFDEINVLSKNATDSGAGAGGGKGANIGSAFDGLEQLEYGEEKVSKLERQIKNLGDVINDFFIKPFKDNLYKFEAPLKRFGDLFKKIGQDSKKWLKPISNWFNTDFKEALSNSISNLTTVSSGFLDSIALVCETLWDGLKPIIDWFVNDGLPLFTDIWTEFSDTLATLCMAVKEIFDAVWIGAIKPAIQIVSDILVDLLNIIKDWWDNHGAIISEKVRDAITTTKDLILNLWEKVLQPMFDSLFGMIKELWDNHLQPLAEQIGEFVATFVEAALDIYNEFIAPIVDWIVNKFGPPITKVFKNVCDIIGDVLGTAIDVVKGIIKALGGVIDFIAGVFTGDWERAWDGVKTYYEGIWDALVEIVKFAINLIIGNVNGLIGAFECAVNFIIKALNKLVGALNTVASKASGGLKKMGIDIDMSIPSIPEVSLGRIPKLATGTVVPANYGEFLAVLGDNKRETEIVSPLSTIKQALTEALRETGGYNTQSGGDIVIPIYLDGGMLDEVMVSAQQRRLIRSNGRG